MLRLGLCCVFHEEPQIKFRTTTVKHLSKFEKAARLLLLDQIALDNAHTLKKAIAYCAANRIGCFRVNSQIWPAYTHKIVGYNFDELPRKDEISTVLTECRTLAQETGVRLAMHPDQFVVLNSQKEEVIAASIAELEYQSRFAEMVGVDVMNVHGGGAFGNKATALVALATGINRLSERARSRLTLENDDVTFTPDDLLPFCEENRIPFVYDVHHHRCTAGVNNVTDDVVREITERAIKTWLGREPLMHISSPAEGWNGPKPRIHHALISMTDFPDCWKTMKIDWTLEVEARHKEVAISKLLSQLVACGVPLWSAKRPTADNFDHTVKPAQIAEKSSKADTIVTKKKVSIVAQKNDLPVLQKTVSTAPSKKSATVLQKNDAIVPSPNDSTAAPRYALRKRRI